MNHLFDSYDSISELVETLKIAEKSKQEGSRLIYIANPGNAGDALIASATWQLFDNIKIKPIQAVAEAIESRDTVLIGGGGNFIPDYQDIRNIIDKCIKQEADKIIILPQTIRGNTETLAKLDARFHIFCRDEISYDWCTKHAVAAKTSLSHDLGLFINREKLKLAKYSKDEIIFMAHALKKKGWIRSFLYWKYHIHLLRGIKNPDIFRSDVESKRTRASSNDISSKYCSKLTTRSEADLISRDLLEVCKSFEIVSTDRLHVGIAAASIGKQVHFFDNNYGKISSIYQHSLANINHIKFIE